MWLKTTIPLALLLLFVLSTDAQTRKVRLRQRPVQIESAEEETSEELGGQVIQYYRPQAKQDNAQELVYISEDEYQNIYAQQQQQQQQQIQSKPRDYRPAITTVRPLQRANHAPTTLAPRTKINEEKAPPVQTIRNYNKVNDDGSFTFGYEAADGSFKEETRGTDCVVRGKYGYIDPDGNKREFTYVSGNPCDPNNPDGEEEEEQNNHSEEQDENIPQNYPKRPVAVQHRPRPTPVPTTRAPTTVFQNRYNAPEEEEEPAIQYAQIPKTTPRPAYAQQTQRPRVQVIHTTPVPQPQQQQQSFNYASPTPSVNITPKPLYKIQNNVLSLQQTQEPATTYRPHTVSIVTPKPAIQTTAAAYIPSKSVTFGHQSANAQRHNGQIDFDAEFKKFTQETGFKPITSPPVTQTTKSVKIQPAGQAGTTANPIYQTQLVYNPSTGQYDSALYQTIPQTDGDFSLNQRIQPYVQQYQIPQSAPVPKAVYRPQPVQQQQQHQPVQHHHQQPQPQPQIPQQVYQKQQNELQFVNSQQLFAQQLQMQQTQLQRDRVEAAKNNQAHRFQLQQAEPSPILRGQGGQQYYYLQPSAQGSGQIEAFLRGQNLEY